MGSNKRTGKIYKITSICTNKIYIGCTIQSLQRRFYKHKNDCEIWLKNNKHFITSFILLEKYNDCKIELIEEMIYINRKELEIKEAFYIDKYKDICVNITKNDYSDKKEKRKKYWKKYYEDNKDKKEYKEKCEQKYQRQSEKVKCEDCNILISKGRMTLHKKSDKHLVKIGEAIKIYSKKQTRHEHYEKYKEQIRNKGKEYCKTKITCECGIIICKGALPKHRRSQRHINIMEEHPEFKESVKEKIKRKTKSIELKEQTKSNYKKYLSEIVTCECGDNITRQSLKSHKLSNKHKSKII